MKTRKTKQFRMALSSKVSIGLLILMFLTGIVSVVLGLKMVDKYEVFPAIQRGYAISIKEEDFKSRFPTRVLDNKGNVLQEFADHSFEYIAYEDMPEMLPKTLYAIEDKRFYKHHGVDNQALFAIAKSVVSGGEIRGGSTLTQQLVKNVYLTSEQTIARKATEAVLAQRVEDQFPKEKIVEFYLNNVYFGNGAYGINTASKTYFNKPITEANLMEMATLVAITNNPTLYDPVHSKEESHARASLIVKEMYQQGVISEKELNEALSTPVNAGIHVQQENTITSYPVKFAIDNTVEQLMVKDGFAFDYSYATLEEEEAYKKAYLDSYEKHYHEVIGGGLVIETSIDTGLQEHVQNTLSNVVSPYGNKDGTATLIDNQSNMVVAVVGGRNPQSEFNAATQGYKQPGSSIKPYISYAPALDRGYTPTSMLSDAKEHAWYPDNWYTPYGIERYSMTMTKALEISANRPAYRLASEMEDPIAPLEKMQFRGLSHLDHNPITSIGGFTNGVRNVDMAAAVNTLVSGGVYHAPTNVSKVTKRSNGEILYERSKEPSWTIYSPSTSKKMLDMMKVVVFGSEGTGKYGNFGYPYLAGKTGSTDNDKDSWYTGATPYYSLAVWTGNDDGSSQYDKAASDVFRSIMGPIHEGKPVVDFVEKSVAPASNLEKQLKDNQEKLARAVKEKKVDPVKNNPYDQGLVTELDHALVTLSTVDFYSEITLSNAMEYLRTKANSLISEEEKNRILVEIDALEEQKNSTIFQNIKNFTDYQQAISANILTLEEHTANYKKATEEIKKRKQTHSNQGFSETATTTTTVEEIPQAP